MTFQTEFGPPPLGGSALLNVAGSWFLGVDDEDPFGGRFIALDVVPDYSAARPTKPHLDLDLDLDLPLAA